MNRIVFFQRKRRKGANYSLEQMFDDLRGRLQGKYECNVFTLPFISSGFIKRIINTISAAFQQGEVNHVTGDINYAAILLKKSKTISTILDLGALHRLKGIKRSALLNIWFKWPVKRSKWVTVISEATKQDLIRNTTCDADKVKVIYVPISQDFNRIDKAFNKSYPRILQIGAAPNKNLSRLIEAVKGIKCELLIIGKISNENQELLRKYEVDYHNKVGIPFPEVIEAYSSSDILFFASTFEGFGMPILEAQATGRAVLTSDLLSMPEVGGNAAHYVDPYNIDEIREGLKKLINDDFYREDLIQKGFENVKRFDPDKIAEQYDALYQDILKNAN